MQNSQSIWPYLTGLLGSLAGLAAFLGYLLNRRQAPATVRLITAQVDVAEATREKTEVEGQSIAFSLISKALADADRTIDRLRAERDKAESEVRILEAQLEKLQGWHRVNEWPDPPETK